MVTGAGIESAIPSPRYTFAMTTLTETFNSEQLLAMPADGWWYELVEGESRRMAPAGMLFSTPPLVIEVLSPSTGAYDRSGKFALNRRGLTERVRSGQSRNPAPRVLGARCGRSVPAA